MDERLEKLRAISDSPTAQPPEAAIDSTEDSRLSKLNRISTLKKKDTSDSGDSTSQSNGEPPELAKFGKTVPYPALPPKEKEKAVKIFNTHFPVGYGAKNAKPTSAVAEMGKSLGKPDEFLGEVRKEGMLQFPKEPVRAALKIEPQPEDIGLGKIDTSMAMLEPTRPAKNPTVRDYLNEYGVTAESLGLSPEFNLDRNLNPADISRFNSMLSIREDIAKEKLRSETEWGYNGSFAGKVADSFLGYFKNVNIGTAGLFKQLDGASKIIGDITGLGNDGTFKDIANYIEDNAVNGLPDLPDDMIGNLVGQVGQLQAFILQMYTPLPGGIAKLPIIMATGGMLEKASELPDVNSLKSRLDLAKTFAEGYITGMVFEYMGKGGAKLGRAITAGKGAITGVAGGELVYAGTKGTKILGQLANAAVNSAGFAGFTAFTQQLQLKDPNGKEIMGSAILGAALSAPHLARLVWGAATAKAMEFEPWEKKGKNKDQAFVPKINIEEALSRIEKIETELEKNPGNQELIAAKTVLSNTVLIDAGRKMIATNPSVALQAIANSDLTPVEKQIYVDKVNKIAAENDTRMDVAQPLITKADELTAQIAFVENNPSIPQTIKDAQIKGLQAQANDLMKKAANVLTEPLVVSERPGEAVTPINTKKGDYVVWNDNRYEVHGFEKNAETGVEQIALKTTASEITSVSLSDVSKPLTVAGMSAEVQPEITQTDGKEEIQGREKVLTAEESARMVEAVGLPPLPSINDVISEIELSKTQGYEYKDNQEGRGILSSDGGRKVVDPANVIGEGETTQTGDRLIQPESGKIGDGAIFNQKGYKIIGEEGDKLILAGNGETIEVERGKVSVLQEPATEKLANVVNQNVSSVDFTEINWVELSDEVKYRANMVNVEIAPNEVMAVSADALKKMSDPVNKEKSVNDVMYEAVEDYRQWRQRGGMVEQVIPIISKTADGTQFTRPNVSYNEAVRNNAKDKNLNIWVRRDPGESNTDRHLLIQFSSDMLNGGRRPTDPITLQYDKMYRLRPGYDRTFDFWEVPLWVPRLASQLPRSDFYVIRDMEEAIKFLESAKYGEISFSVLDINEKFVAEIADAIPGQKIAVGGYTSFPKLKDKKNIKIYETVESFLKDNKLPIEHSYSYQHFFGTKAIPRFRMSSGCLFKCAFCSPAIPRVIEQTPDAVIDAQVKSIATLDATLVYLDDKTFGQAPNHKRLPEIYNKMKESNPDFEGFIIQTTAGQMLKFDDQYLADAHIVYVELGIESYNDPILKRLHKPASERTMDLAVEKLRRNKIKFIPNLVIGFGGFETVGGKEVSWEETPETYQHTLDFLERNADTISHINMNTLALYEGSELGDSIDARIDATEADLNQKEAKKSFHKTPEVHVEAVKKFSDFAMKILDYTPYAEKDKYVLVAPYYDMKITDLDQARAVRMSPAYHTYINNIKGLADIMGVKIDAIDDTVGRFEGFNEVSNNITITARSIEDVNDFAAVISVMAGESQKSVIAGKYLDLWDHPNQTAIEWNIKVSTPNGVLDIMKEAGINDATFNDKTNLINILDFSNGKEESESIKNNNFITKLNENGIETTEKTYRPVQSSLIESKERTGILQSYRDSRVQIGPEQGESRIRALADKAIARNEEHKRIRENEPTGLGPEKDNIHSQLAAVVKTALANPEFSGLQKEIKTELDKRIANAPNAAPSHVVLSQNQFPERLLSAARSQAGPGYTPKIHAAWDDLTGEVWFAVNNLKSPEHALGVFFHEQGLHHGIRALIPDPTDLNNFLENVYNSVPKKKIIDTVDPSYVEAHQDGIISDAALAEEYMARLSQKIESGTADQVEKGLWQKILDYIRKMLKKLTGKDVHITDKQINDVIKASIATNYEYVSPEKPLPAKEIKLSMERLAESDPELIEGLKREGWNPGQSYSKREIYQILENYHVRKFGRIGKLQSTNGLGGEDLVRVEAKNKEVWDRTIEVLAPEVAAEVAYMYHKYKDPKYSGDGWYDELYQNALIKASRAFPEIIENTKGERDLFTMFDAISSDGTAVFSNFESAVVFYNSWRMSGKVKSTKLGGPRNVSYNSNLKRVGELIDPEGPFKGDIKAATAWLLQEKTGTEIKKLCKELGLKYNSQWPEHLTVPVAAAIFGPKIGMFFANLEGLHKYITEDRWVTRFIGSIRGTVIPDQAGYNLEDNSKIEAYKKLTDTPNMSDEDAYPDASIRARNYAKRAGPNGKGKYWTELEQKIGFKYGTTTYENAAFNEAVKGLIVKDTGMIPELFRNKEQLINDNYADRAASVIYKKVFTEVVDAPFSPQDRELIWAVYQKAQEILKEEYKIDDTVDNIQARHWYFGKKTYIDMGGESDAVGVSYDDVADKVIEEHLKGKRSSRDSKKLFGKIDQETKDFEQFQNRMELFSMEKEPTFRSENEKPIGFNYDTKRLARDRFDIPKLLEIGMGSDRTVFALPGDRVLKVAHSPRGMAQNVHEGSWDLQSEGIIPKYYERGLNYLIAQRADPAGNYAQARIDPLYKQGNNKVNDIIDDLVDFPQKDFDNRTPELQKALQKHGLEYVMNYPVTWSDFTAVRNWGVIDGKPVHIDGGTFGGMSILNDYRGRNRLRDEDFEKIAEISQKSKKQYGDPDKYTMFSKESISEENKKAIVDAIIRGAGKYASLSPELPAEEITRQYKENLLNYNPEIPEYIIDEALGIGPNKALDEEFTTSLKNQIVDEEIILRSGANRLEELKDQLNRELTTDIDDIFNMAKAGLDRGSIDPDEVAKRVIQVGVGSDIDEAVLLIKRAQFRAERITLINEQANAKTKDEMYAVDAAIKELSESQINNDLAGKLMGRMASNIFRLRQRFVNEEYDLLEQIRQYKELNRGEIEPEVEAKFRELSDKLIKAEAKIVELEKIRETEEVNAGLRDLERQSKRVYGPRNKVSDGLKSMADALKIPKDQRPKFSQEDVLFSKESTDPVFEALKKIGKGLIDEGTANLVTVAGKTKDIVEKNFPGQVNVDKYADELNIAMAEHIGKPSVVEGRVKVPGKFVKDLVSQGYINIDDVVTLTKQLINDETVTDRDVRDAITKYVKEATKPQSKLQTQINEMERVGRLISEYEDIVNEHKLKESKGKPHPITKREEILKGKIKQIKKDFNLKTPVERVRETKKLDRLNSQLEDLRRGIIPQSAPSDPKQLSAEEARLRMEILEEKSNLRENAKISELQNKLNDIKNGVTHTPKTHTPAQRSRAVNNLMDQIDLAKKQSAEQAKIDKLQQQLDDIKKGIIHPKIPPTPKQISDAEKQLRAEIQAEKKLTYDSETEVLKRYKEGLQRSIDRYKERIKNQEFGPPAKSSPILDADAMRLEIEKQDIKYEFEKLKEKARLKNRPIGDKILDMGVDVLSIPKSLLASGDLSYLLRQGVILSAGHPMMAARAFVESLRMFHKEENETKWMSALRASDIFPILKKAGLDLSDPHSKLAAREEMFLSNLANKIPLWGDTQRFKMGGKNITIPGLGVVSRSSRSYTGFLNKMRVDVFAAGYDDMASRGFDINRDIESFKAWAELINISTGRGSLGKVEQFAPYLNLIFFAPKLVVSRFSLLFGLPRQLGNLAYEALPNKILGRKKPKLPPIINDNLDPLVRRMHLKNMLAFIGLASMILTLLSLTDFAEVEIDPRSSDFGKARIGNLRIDIWAGFQQIIRTIVQFITGERKSAQTGVIREFNPKEFPFSNRLDIIGGFMRNKLSPAASTAVDALTGKNAVGEPFVLENEPIENIVPLYLQDMKDIYINEGLGLAVGAAIPGLLGAGTQYYLPKPPPQSYHWVKVKGQMRFQKNPEFWKRAMLPDTVTYQSEDSRVSGSK
jgi:hypothetical protein